MPAFYAHYHFGHLVKKSLPLFLQEEISRYPELFDIGLHGPDILFFCRPVRIRSVAKKGQHIHHEPGRLFFANGLQVLRSLPAERTEQFLAMKVYLIGAVCHYALDASCHPYINRYQAHTGISHHEIEKEFEKHLMRTAGIDPFSWDCAMHLSVMKQWASLIAPFYQLPPERIYQGLSGLLFYTHLFFSENPFVRNLIFAGMRISGQYRSVRGFFANRKDNTECLGCSLHLEYLLNRTISETVSMINELNAAVDSGLFLSDRFEQTFSG